MDCQRRCYVVQVKKKKKKKADNLTDEERKAQEELSEFSSAAVSLPWGQLAAAARGQL